MATMEVAAAFRRQREPRVLRYRRAMPEGALHRFDHLVVGISDLATGIDQLAAMTGVEAVIGGEHPHLGTHNALASLGPTSYLEIVAPRPGAKASDSRFARLSMKCERLTPILWAAATDDADATRAILGEVGVDTTEPVPGSRRTPDGRILEWRIFDVAEPRPATAPFFIEWAPTTPHPATSSPGGCTLTELELMSEDAASLEALLEALAIDLPVIAGERPQIRAALSGSRGRMWLPEKRYPLVSFQM